MHILVVDDDTMCRLAIERGLQLRGHTTESCEDGFMAYQLYAGKDKPFDWILTDFQMPTRDGYWLCEQIRDLNPNQKILVQTGDPGRAQMKFRRSLNGLIVDIPIIAKPFSMKELEKRMGLKPPLKVWQP